MKTLELGAVDVNRKGQHPGEIVARVLALVVGSLWIATAMAQTLAPGFLVIAPDRGYLGNREVKEAFADFAAGGYDARLVFISLLEDETPAVGERLRAAFAELHGAEQRRVVLVPMVLARADPHLQRAIELLDGAQVEVAPTLDQDYLAAQIVEDRAQVLSHEPGKERLLLVGYGATSAEEAAQMAGALERLGNEVKRRLPFQAVEAAVLHHSNFSTAPEAQEALAKRIRQAATAQARTLLVPVHIGYKHTPSMALDGMLAGMVAGTGVAYNGEAFLPHSNVARWLKKTANRYFPPRREEIGVIVMPHGAGEYLNAPILSAIEPLASRYKLEVAFGMAETESLQEAIDKLEARGARRIVVLRLYATSNSLKQETEYVLGLTDTLSGDGHMHHHGHGAAAAPARVRASAVLATVGGLDADPLISEVLLERAKEVSEAPEKETVILLAHGAGPEETEQHWLKQMAAQAEFIRANARPAYRAVKYATVREDWPGKREQAVAQVREMVEEAARDGGRALVIADRVAGAGPYRRFLSGLDYAFNGKGIAPHPNLSRWMEQEVERWIGSLTAVAASPAVPPRAALAQ